MKKIIKLKESDIKRIVSEVLTEQNTVDNIKLIQRKLIDLKYDLGPKKDDGVYGPKTRQAVIKYQTDNKIEPTGFVGDITAKSLGVNSLSKKGTQLAKPKGDSVLSSDIDTKFSGKIDLNKLSSTDSMSLCKAGQEQCAQFVSDFSKKIVLGQVGDAWTAHDNDKLGKRVWSVYTQLTPKQVEKIFQIFKNLNSVSGKKLNGSQRDNIIKLQAELIKPISPSVLKVNDIVGIYYPPSGYHETAFYNAATYGKGYFVKKDMYNWEKGETIKSGKGFGFNTHVGVVGAIKDGVPLIFHNIHGQVYSDPYNKLKDYAKIAWVRRLS